MFSIVKLQKCVYALFITFIVIAFLPAVSFSDEETKVKKCPCWETKDIISAAYDAAEEDAGLPTTLAWEDDPCKAPDVVRIIETQHHPKGIDPPKTERFLVRSSPEGVVNCKYTYEHGGVQGSLQVDELTDQQCRACNRDLEMVYKKFVP